MARRIRAVAYRNQMSVHNISMHEDESRVYVDLHLEVDDHFSLQQAHAMASHIERDLRLDMPEIAQVYTHLESRGTGMGDGRDVTAVESEVVSRVKSLSNEIAGAGSCHNVVIRRQSAGLAVSLHCHFPEHLSIVDVHDRSTRIEERIKTRIPGVSRVLVHAEPRTAAEP
jgi:divalent metal cation (Fe/Co/Zn/Cd) transporter